MGSKQQVVMIHGWCGSSEHFHDQQQFLSENYDVFVPQWFQLFEDQYSSKNNLIHQAASFLVDYFKQHHINEPILIGHSMVVS